MSDGDRCYNIDGGRKERRKEGRKEREGGREKVKERKKRRGERISSSERIQYK